MQTNFMQTNLNPSDTENQLLCLLRMLRTAMQGLSKFTLLTQPEWDLLDQAWLGALENDVQVFEQAINDLDSKTHFHDHQLLGLEGGAQYRLVRELIRCVQDIWPAFFQAH